MEAVQQLAALSELKPSFIDKLSETETAILKTNTLEILQLNVTKRCNLSCKHCHVNAGPEKQEMMPRQIFDAALDLIKEAKINTVDITGGAPEMNPDLASFIRAVRPLVKRLIIRSNLVILKESSYRSLIDLYAELNVEIVASLPHYIDDQTDKQRGLGTFSDSIEIIGELNNRGYGKTGSGKILNFVHNPVGAFLPGEQQVLEAEFKRRLKSLYGIHFNQLFCITNMPLGRYLAYLKKTDNYDDYMSDLICSFNPAAASNVMCKNTLNVSWEGKLYHCDFNQMLGLEAEFDGQNHLGNFIPDRYGNSPIVTGNHCFGCTAGSGSSCQGTID